MTTAKLTAEQARVLGLLAEALRDTESAEGIFDVLLERLDDARERRKERVAAEREQEASERKRQQQAWWRACRRGHERPDMCGPECARSEPRREAETQIVESPGASLRKTGRLG